MVITRLGAGVDRERRLAPDAVERTLAVLREYRDAMDHWDVGHTRAVATSAARDASNGPEFLDTAGAVLGTAPELLSGLEEGRLSFRGATASLPGPTDQLVLVVDIGGGSTELAVGRPDRPDQATAASIDIGCVRVSERYLFSDPPAADELAEARRAVDALLAEGASHLPDPRVARQLVGLAGTVSAAAVMDSGAVEYRYEIVHHHVLVRARVRRLLERLSVLDHAGRLKVPALEPDRADVIVGGLVVLEAVMDAFGFEECMASEADILDGLVASMLPGT